MLNKKEFALQAKALAQLRQAEIERKSKNVIKCGANLNSQWGQVVQNETRLIDNGHYLKFSKSDDRSPEEKNKARLLELEAQLKKAKPKKPAEIVRVTKEKKVG